MLFQYGGPTKPPSFMQDHHVEFAETSSAVPSPQRQDQRQESRPYIEVTSKGKAQPLHVIVSLRNFYRTGGAKGGKGYVRPSTPVPDGFDTFAERVSQLDQFRFEATVRKAYSLISDIHNKLDLSFPESHIMDPKPLPGVEDVLSVRRMEERYGEMPTDLDDYLRRVNEEFSRERLRNAELERRKKNYHRHYKNNIHGTRDDVISRLREKFVEVKAECLAKDISVSIAIVE